jgi:hypothetical protein
MYGSSSFLKRIKQKKINASKYGKINTMKIVVGK